MGDLQRAEYLARKGIRDREVLKAIARLRRADFVGTEQVAEAEEDAPLPIGFGQTISQPYVVAFMSEALGLTGTERVLELGTGSGYQTAVLAQLAAEVFTVEIIPELARTARDRLSRLGLTNVHYRVGDGARGWPDAAPFDAILSAAATETVPHALLAQLGPGGRLILPVGGQGERPQQLVRVTKPHRASREPLVEALLSVRFVPMTGSAPLPV